MKTLKERDNFDLLELVQQLHSRTGMHHDNKDMHDAWVAARAEMIERITTLMNEKLMLTNEKAYLNDLVEQLNEKNQRHILDREELMKAFAEFKTGQRTARELYDLLEKYKTG